MQYYCVDLFNGKNVPLADLDVYEYDSEDLKRDMRADGATDPLKMSDYFDRMVFKSEDDAEAFLRRYIATWKSLTKDRYKKPGRRPVMLYNRRQLILGLMGIKLSTEREFDRPWEPGQEFDLWDRAHFMTVRLTKKEKRGKLVNYSFEVVK